MTEHDRERSLDETQPIQTPEPDAPAVDAPVVDTPAPTAAAPTPAAAAIDATSMPPADAAASPTTPPSAAAPSAEATPWYAEGAAVQPVQTARRGSGARWAVAAVLIVAVVGVAAGAAMLLTGRAAEPDAYTYLPASAAMVMEVRPDLPGDQREKLAQLVSKFPGFADQSTFESKLDEAIDRFADAAAERDVDYANEVKPFLGHPIVVAITKVPEDPDAKSTDGFVAIATSSGTPRCDTTGFGTATETVEHAGRTISIADGDGTKIACVVDGQNILAGGLEDVKLALDTKAGSSSLASDPSLDAARAQLSGDTLGLIYLSKAGFDAFAEVAERQQAEQGMPAMDLSGLPDWMVMGVRAEGDGLLFDAVMPMPVPASGASPLPSMQPSKVSALASRLPASTVAVLEARELGTTLDATLDQVAANPAQAELIKQLDTALAIMGGRAAVLAWMGDASIVVTRDGTAFGGGLVVATPDESKATATMTQLRTILGMAGGRGIEVADEAYGSGTITTFSFDLEQLAGAIGADGGADLPEQLDIAYTVQKGLVVFGVGSDFVKAVLDTVPGQTLADQPRYQAAMALVGATNGGQAYLDLAAGIDAIEELALPLAGPDALTEWQRDVAPFVEPLDAVAWSVSGDGGFLRLRIGLTAHETQQ